ncbi:MAG: hypothetical protein LBN95_12875 [Prevotellaceae bacterium]|jgi:hypothetical protein|nr:hypothetical protein [Prevotellaceae bacterium]
MQIGPNLIYKCPKCGEFIQNGSLISGNTLHAQIYSDAKQIAGMLPEYPNLTKCQKCNEIFWLSDLKKVDAYFPVFLFKDASKNKSNPEWANADYADFLDINDLHRALEMFLDKETVIRRMIWWKFNDRVRKGKDLFIDETDEHFWQQNCNRLLELFDKNDTEQQVMIAELYRNLGQFDNCLEIINGLPDDFNWLKDKFREECSKQNKLVFRLE